MLTPIQKNFLISLMIFFMNLIAPPGLEAFGQNSKIKEGNAYYQHKQFDKAVESYEEALKKNRESDIINFDLGTAYYKRGEYDKAVEHLQKGILSDDKNIQYKAYHNLGNSLYQMGKQREEDNLGLAISFLEKSLRHFDGALKIQPQDEDTKVNYEFVKDELERLKKKQEEQKQNTQQAQNKDTRNSQSEQPKEQDDSAQNSSQQQPAGQNENKEDSSSEDKKESPQEQKQGASEEPGEGGDSQYNKGAASSQPMDSKELSEKEAKMLLEAYQGTEEPKGLLNLQKKTGPSQDVLKDW